VSKPLIYVAGPYTKGEPIINVRKAIMVADAIMERGAIAYVPHLCHFWHFMFPHDYDFWIDHGLEMLTRCDALYRISGYSKGAELETSHALTIGIPLFDEMSDLTEWLFNRKYGDKES